MASEQLRENLKLLRRAAGEHRKVVTRYVSLWDETTERTLCPMLLYFWGSKWTLGAWCELRRDFRSFRVDLLSDLTMSEDLFELVSGRDAAAYMAQQAGRFDS